MQNSETTAGMFRPPLFMSHEIIQMAWVVEDLEHAMAAWVNTNGVGPFFVSPLQDLVDELDYRGQKISLPDTKIRLALAQAGDIQIELIEQQCGTSTLYREFVPAGQSALHHIAIIAKEYDKEIDAYEKQGCAVATTGTFKDVRWSYVDTSRTLGCVTELLERNPLIEGFFKLVRDAASGWDGADPIRKLS